MPNQPYSNLAIIKRFLPFTRPYIKKYMLAIILLVATSVLQLLPPMLLKVIVDDAIKSSNLHLLNVMAGVMILIVFLSGLSRFLMEYLHEWVSAWFIFDLRRYLYNHVQAQSMDFFSSVKVGEIIGRLRQDTASVYAILVNTLIGSLSEIIQIIGITAILFFLNYKLALIAIGFVPLLYLILALSGKRLRLLSRALRDKDIALLEFFQEKINNIHVIKLFHREEYEDLNHTRLSEAHIRSGLRRLRYKFSNMFLISTLTSLASVIIIWYGGYQVIGGSLSFGSFFAFYLYTVRLYGPIQSLANRSLDISNALASADKLMEYLDLVPTVRESEQPVEMREIFGEICFDRVSFKYPSSQSYVIDDFKLNIPAGQKVALVGLSGSGKSTLVNLLCRLYDVDSGSIQIDGTDIRDIELNSLYDAIGVVSQDTYLFNSTIEDNIRYGRIDADHQDIVKAARKAHLHEFIQQLPDGYDTIVGSRGIKLSGGQRQRLALARIILKNPKIWILDEFTSSLDSRSEAVVYDNIESLLRDKTTLIIAHRFSTILSADQVIVIQNGQIIETGSHAYLYNKNGVYRDLFDTQFQRSPVLPS